MSEFSTTAVIEARLASGTVSQIESKLEEIGPVTVGVEPSATDMAADGGAAAAGGGMASSMLSDQNAHLATATDQLDENLGLNEERNDILREILDTNEMIARQDGGGNILTNLISGGLGLAGGGLAIAAVLASELMSVNWSQLFKDAVGNIAIGVGDLIVEGGKATIKTAKLIVEKATVTASKLIAGAGATVLTAKLLAQKATVTTAKLIADKATVTLGKLVELVQGDPSGQGSGQDSGQGSGTGRPSPQAGPVGSDQPQDTGTVGRPSPQTDPVGSDQPQDTQRPDSQPGRDVPVPTDVLFPRGPNTPQSGTVTVNPNRPQATVGSNSGVGLKEILVGGAGLAVAGGLAASDGPLPFGDFVGGALLKGLLAGGGLAATSGAVAADGSENGRDSGGNSTDSSRGTPDRQNTTVEATVENDIEVGLDVRNSREVQRLLSDPEGYIEDILNQQAGGVRR